MPWVSRLLRGDRVFVRTMPDGTPVTGSDGRVDILYKRGGKVYRASLRNLETDPTPQRLPDEEPASADAPASAAPASRPSAAAGAPASRPSAAAAGRAAPPPAKDPFIVYADGACTGNPGPCGIGVVLLDGNQRREISEYLGEGTNNIAELTALIRALEIAPHDRTVILHSDSAYALGLLGKNWKAKANVELVEKMRALARNFRDLRLVKVAGHAGIAENERADALARDAVVKRR